MTPDRSYPPHEAVAGTRGVASSAHPYATQAAIAVLAKGGSAVDAAIAAGAVLTVVSPWAGQLGGDCFFQVSEADGSLGAVNGSGAAPAAATLEHYQNVGEIPSSGWLASSVPGMVDGWRVAHARWGKLAWSALFEAATRYADEGIVITPSINERITGQAELWARFPATASIFLSGGTAPPVGAILRQPDLAETFRAIAGEGPQAFYQGEIARRIAEESARDGGLFAYDDLAGHTTPEPEPLRLDYRGTTITVQAPVTQGIIVLMALGALGEHDLATAGPLSADKVHLQVEAIKQGFADRISHLGDPAFVDVPVDELLSAEANRGRARAINPARRSAILSGVPAHADTTSLVTADGDGQVVAYIHSLYAGSGVVVPGTGIMMNNRLMGFSLEPDSPNVIEPGKRPVHTLNTVMVHRPGEVYAICTPGANLQVQHNLQVVTNLLDFEMEMQAAVDAPRWSMGDQMTIGDDILHIEDRFGEVTIDGLRERGHQVDVSQAWAIGGGIQVARADRDGGTVWATRDPRRASNLAAAL